MHQPERYRLVDGRDRTLVRLNSTVMRRGRQSRTWFVIARDHVGCQTCSFSVVSFILGIYAPNPVIQFTFIELCNRRTLYSVMKESFLWPKTKLAKHQFSSYWDLTITRHYLTWQKLSFFEAQFNVPIYAPFGCFQCTNIHRQLSSYQDVKLTLSHP